MRRRLRISLLLALAGLAGAATAVAADELTVALTAKPSNPSSARVATFGFSAEPPGENVTFGCLLDAKPPVECDTTFTTPELGEGQHTFQVEGATPNGKTGTSPTYTWMIDTIAPQAQITATPPNPSGSRNATFEFTSDEPGATFECWRDAAAPAACTSPLAIGDIEDGEHTFSVRARDAAGNTGAAATYTWTVAVDTTPPAVTIRSGPPASTSDRVARFEFDVDDAGARIQCSVDDATPGDCGSPYTTPELAPGAHSFAVIATDSIGNSRRVTYPWTITAITINTIDTSATVDTTPPESVDPVDYFVSYRYAQLRWTPPADADFDHVTVFRRSGQERTAIYSGKAARYVDAKFDNAVDHRYEIVSYDSAGNAAPAARLTISSSALLASPRRGAVVRRSPTLRWAPIARARFYNVQIFRNGRKIVSTWPRRPRVRLAKRWRYGKPARTYRLTRGTYEWYVWPAFGPRNRIRYGPALGHSRFVFR